MAGSNGTTSRPLAILQSLQKNTLALLTALRENPFKYGFYQAVRRIECAYKDKPRIGTSLRPKDDPVRFGQPPSTSFAPSSLSYFKLGEKGLAPKMGVNFIGVFGPNGALPIHLTEYARSRIVNDHDKTLSGFVDVYHHRLISLFYRAWANAQPTVNYDRPDKDQFAKYVGALIGIGMPSLRNRDSVQDRSKFYYSGWLGNQAKNAEGLRAIISDYFAMPAQIEQFVPQWIELPKECQLLLGINRETGTLGRNAAIGKKAWECQQKFRIVMGPLNRKQYLRMLPGGESLKHLQALVRNYVGDELAWDLKLVMKHEQMPSLKLGATGMLGWTARTWSRRIERDVDELIVNPSIYYN
jgi:type VI secretion system protein ImpH